jgi:hypothetical protein
MARNRRRQCFTAWIASFAILLASLVPSISHALSAAQPADSSTFAEICSVHKLQKTADAVSSGIHSPVEKDWHIEHCPFCFTHADALALPPSAKITVPAATGSSLHTSLFFHSPRPLFAWIAAQPRAPPVIS